MPRVVPLPRVGGSGRCPRALRERWRRATLAAGWSFPSDWGVPAVDAVCEAVAEGRDPVPALGWLGRARAESGAGLEETLRDLAALYTSVLAMNLADATDAELTDLPDLGGGSASAQVDAVPGRLLRAAAVGWADVTSGEIASAQVVDELTGLTTSGYLRTRLGEVYRAAYAAGLRVPDRHALVVLALDLSRTGGWSRLVPMLMAADAMRAVFDGGETLALAGPSVAAVLCDRDDALPLRARRLRRAAVERLAADPDAARAGPVRVWLERLPMTYPGACDLLAQLGR